MCTYMHGHMVCVWCCDSHFFLVGLVAQDQFVGGEDERGQCVDYSGLPSCTKLLTSCVQDLERGREGGQERVMEGGKDLRSCHCTNIPSMYMYSYMYLHVSPSPGTGDLVQVL